MAGELTLFKQLVPSNRSQINAKYSERIISFLDLKVFLRFLNYCDPRQLSTRRRGGMSALFTKIKHHRPIAPSISFRKGNDRLTLDVTIIYEQRHVIGWHEVTNRIYELLR